MIPNMCKATNAITAKNANLNTPLTTLTKIDKTMIATMHTITLSSIKALLPPIVFQACVYIS